MAAPRTTKKAAATRKSASTAALRPASKSSAGPVHFNLDTYEREDVHETFVAVLGGKRIEMIDPKDIEWQILADLDSPVDFIDHCMTDKDREYLLSLRLTGAQLNALMDAYGTHYGIGDRGKGFA